MAPSGFRSLGRFWSDLRLVVGRPRRGKTNVECPEPASRAEPSSRVEPPREEHPLISIVLLCYNHERFVAEALEGVFAQTYSPLEIIIVDDCSQDRTAQIVAERLAQLSDRPDIRLIRNPRNMTLLGTCKIAFEAARGEFIVLTCDDDVMLPEMVAEMAKVWQAENVSLVNTNAYYIDENSEPLGRIHHDLDVPPDDTLETLVRDGSNACCFGATMGFERELYLNFGMPPTHLDNFDIMVPFYAYLMKGARFINKPLLKYRVHGQNNSLSLIAERSNEFDKLLVHERIHYAHMAHAVVMQDTIERLSLTMPARYAKIAERIEPLLTIQMAERAKKLVKTRIALAKQRK
jgi:glycosyltransferase involved in cell wall biosynthesis